MDNRIRIGRDSPTQHLIRGRTPFVAAEALLREVEERTQRELELLVNDFEAKKKEILAQREEEINRIRSEAYKEAEQQSQKEKTRLLGAARLHAKRILFDATEKFVQKNLLRMQDLLAEYASSESYSELLKDMIRYARRRLGDELVAECRKQDETLLESEGVEVSSSDLKCIGGAVFATKDGALELDLRFEELFRIHEEELRAAILSRQEQ
jgi:vacuolar-type H+-ATPase subunit E/Vma4